jgi:hypothetical protein
VKKCYARDPFFFELEIASIKALKARSWPSQASAGANRVQIRVWSPLASKWRRPLPTLGRYLYGTHCASRIAGAR